MYPCMPFILFFLLPFSSSYKYYQNAIPNGDRIPHPCFRNESWPGVGHIADAGGGPQNAFGKDFAKAGHKWTQQLCQMDSDCDGQSNGAELGDPACEWKPGSTPQRTWNITHPGVCEPLTSSMCKACNRDWKVCATKVFRCPATKQPAVRRIDFRFNRTRIPTKETNYFCQAFEFPMNVSYHMIASEPLIDNAAMMHHAFVFGCSAKPKDAIFEKPHKCGMAGTGCRQVLALWTLGSQGECLPDQFGMRCGASGFRYVVLQFHWNNPQKLADQFDASGIRFHLTERLRPNDGAVMVTGQRYLELPPRHVVVQQQAICSGECTRASLNESVFLVNVLAHMHYAGTHAEISQYRQGAKVRTLLPITEIKYNSPQRFHFDPPIELRPGDAVHLKCFFRTVTINHTIFYGESTQDEMCYAFFSYFPYVNFPADCVSFGPVDMCTMSRPENGGIRGLPGRVENCSVATFLLEDLPKKWLPLLTEFCDFSLDKCHWRCMEVLKKMLEEEPCWTGWAKKIVDFLSIDKLPAFARIRDARLRLSACVAEQAAEQNQSGLEDNSFSYTALYIIIVIAAGMVLLILILVLVCLLTSKEKASFTPQPRNASIMDDNFVNIDFSNF